MGNLSLPELAARYGIKDIYGASVAYFSSREGGVSDLRVVNDRICCYEMQLILSGYADVDIAGRKHHLDHGSLLVLTPYQPAQCHFSANAVTEGLLIDRVFYDGLSSTDLTGDVQIPGIPSKFNTVYQLTESQTQELSGIFRQIQKAIHYMHLYKAEMIQSLVHIFKLFISELPFKDNVLTPDFRNKENIYKIFLHLSERNFRRERQIQFYADKIGITTTYLSRVVKEISGTTVNDHLTRRVYHEACNLLKTTTKTMGEIAFELGFKDQSAFTNFFKLHAHCSPKCFRKDQQTTEHPHL